MQIFESQQILDLISRHCPEAMSTYIQCLNRMDSGRTFFFSRQKIEVEMSESYCKFVKNLKKLAKDNLLEWHPFDNGVSVTLAEIE